MSVNIFELRGTIKKEIPFIEGAWVEFYDDMVVNDIILAQSVDVTKPDSFSMGLENFFKQVADWNFADKDGKALPVTFESFKLLPMKIITWMGEMQKEIMTPKVAGEEKKST